MTQAQQTQFEKALAKATIENLHIVGKGTVKATRQQFYAVSSSDGTGCYTVIIAGHALVCNCQAGRNGQYCKHRALVRQAIVNDAPNATAPDADKARHTAPVLTERMTDADWLSDRATAMPVRGNQGAHSHPGLAGGGVSRC